MKRDYKNQKGMTLVELLVACSVMVLLSGILSVIIGKTFFINRYTIEQGVNTASLQSSLKNFTEHLREARQSDAGGFPIELADDFEIVFYANVDDDPDTERVHYYLENTQLKIGISKSSGFPPVYPDYDQQTKTIGNGIINSGEQNVFSYYNSDYPIDTENNPLATPATPGDINIIKIDLYVNTDPNNIPENMRMSTFVRPRNL